MRVLNTMATRHNPPWLHTAIHALLLFSTVEAVTLSQFQQISPDQIPSSCLSVYTSAIAECVEADFAAGASCSLKCTQGINTKASNLRTFCAGIQVNPKSLIGIALGGDLLGLLCPLPLATSTKIPGFTTIPFPTATTKDPIDPIPTSTIITTTTSQVTTNPPPSPPPPPSTTVVQTPTLVPPPSSSSDSTDTDPSTIEPLPTTPVTSVTPPSASIIGPPPAPVDPPPPPANDQTPQPIEQNGSPFADINLPGAGNSPCAPPITWMMLLSAAVSLGLRAL